MRRRIDEISDDDLVNEGEDVLAQSVLRDFVLHYPSIDEHATKRVERGVGAADPGFVIYEHEVNDQSGLLRYNLAGMLFPAPRHEASGVGLLLRYPANESADAIESKHGRDFGIFRHNAAAACTNAESFNKSVEAYIRSALKTAREAAEKRKRLTADLEARSGSNQA